MQCHNADCPVVVAVLVSCTVKLPGELMRISAFAEMTVRDAGNAHAVSSAPQGRASRQCIL